MMRLPTFATIVADGEKALVTKNDGSRQEVVGPARIWSFSGEVEFYDRVVLKEHEGATLYAADGTTTDVEGPMVVHVSPYGELQMHETHPLLPHEAMVVVDIQGKPTIYVGMGYDKATGDGDDTTPAIKKVPQVVVKARETVHQFKWTGSKGDTEYKAPGMLRFDKLRLQETQTWFAVEARTKDGIMVVVNLMIFIKFYDVAKLLVNDDPMGVMFNSIGAAILEKLGKTTFDAFRKNPAETIGKEAQLADDSSKEMLDKLDSLGVSIERVNLRKWTPMDQAVERLMAQEASVTARQAVDEAEHLASLKRIANRNAELVQQAGNEDVESKAAALKGKLAAKEVAGFTRELRRSVTYTGKPEALVQLVALRETAKAATGGLTITQEAMVGKTGQ